jgi:hypothetical protein
VRAPLVRVGSPKPWSGVEDDEDGADEGVEAAGVAGAVVGEVDLLAATVQTPGASITGPQRHLADHGATIKTATARDARFSSAPRRWEWLDRRSIGTS